MTELTTVVPRPYRARVITFLGVSDLAGWTVKLYGIAADTPAPRAELVDATRSLAAEALPQPPREGGRHGVGFAIAHDAADYCFALVDWWSGGNEIHQRVFSSPLDRPADLRPHATPAIGCVWELAVVDHERRAWLRHVLSNPTGPDLDAYLRASIEERI